MGDLSNFIRRHVGASLIGAAGLILAGLGYADQARAIATGLPPWALQALGAAFFVTFVVKVLASYDKDHRLKSEPKELPPIAPGPTAALEMAAERSALQHTKKDPNVLPSSIADEYLALKLDSHTDLQEARFLRAYEGKLVDLNLHLHSLENDQKRIRALLYHAEGEKHSSMIIADFAPAWEDHLSKLKRGDKIHFRAKITPWLSGAFKLSEAEPI